MDYDECEGFVDIDGVCEHETPFGFCELYGGECPCEYLAYDELWKERN